MIDSAGSRSVQQRVLRTVMTCAVGFVALVHFAGNSVSAQGQAQDAETVPQSAQGQRLQLLTVDDLIGMALGANPTLRQAAAEVERLRGQWWQAGLYPNPRFGYSAAEINNGGQAGQQGAQVQQSIVLGGKLGLDQAIVSGKLAAARRNFEAQRLRVITDVRLAYYDVLLAEQSRQVQQQLVALGERVVELTESALAAQQVGRADALQAQVELSTARIALANANVAYDAAWRQLAAAMGMPALAPAPLDGKLDMLPPQIDYNVALHRVLAASPELGAAQGQLTAARWKYERALAEPISNLGLSYSPQYDTDTGFAVHGVQAMVNVPLFDRNQGNIYAARAEVVAAQREIQRIELSLTERLAAAFQEYAAAGQQAEMFRSQILPAARETLELTTLAYREGEQSFVALLTAQRTFFRANLDYLSAQWRVLRSAALIDGLLLSGNLQRPPSNDG